MREQSNLQKCLSAAGMTSDSYSGRSMFNRSCISTTIDAESPNAALLNVAVDIMKASYSLLDSNVIDGLDFDDILDAVKTARVDSMGKGYVVYFPSVEYFVTDDSELAAE